MKKYLVFYAVDNKLELCRHDLESLSFSEAMEKLNQLPDEEVIMYELTDSYATKGLSLPDFVNDYNDELFDGSYWWCDILTED